MPQAFRQFRWVFHWCKWKKKRFVGTLQSCLRSFLGVVSELSETETKNMPPNQVRFLNNLLMHVYHCIKVSLGGTMPWFARVSYYQENLFVFKTALSITESSSIALRIKQIFDDFFYWNLTTNGATAKTVHVKLLRISAVIVDVKWIDEQQKLTQTANLNVYVRIQRILCESRNRT